MTQRRLAAILAADMVGYSRLMAADEAGTLARLKALRREVIDPEIARGGGEIAKLTGDGMLVLFGSVVDAVEAAVAVQRAVAEAEAATSAERRIAFRIGINLGDVILDEGDIYGDGVNIAARLEAAADPGGITLSDDAMRQVRGKTELAFIDLGELELKNLPHPVRAHKVDLDPARLTPAEFEALTGEKLELPDKPSIAVLPFQNMSGDPEQEFFADGISEDIITFLSRVSDMVVIARNSTFLYKGRAVDVRQVGRELGVGHVLEGSVRQAGDRIRITAQLIDAATGDHVWAERFDRGLDDIFAIQDEITREIVTNLGVRLGHGEEARVWGRKATSLESWQTSWRSLTHAYRFTREDNIEGIRLAREAIALDGANDFARQTLGWQLVVGARLGFAADPGRNLAEARSLVDEGLARSADDADWLALDGSLKLSEGEFDAAVTSGLRSIELAPNVSNNHAVLALTHLYSGEHEAGLARIRKAIRLSPHCPEWYLTTLGVCCQGTGDLDRARAVFEHAVVRLPDSPLSWTRLAAVAALQGDDARSSEAMRAVLEIDPDFRVGPFMAAVPYRRPEDRETYVAALRKAGLPG